MSVQQFLPQEPPDHVSKGRHAGISLFFLLAGLWRLICWFWSILIAGAIAGILGNTAYSYFTTGMLNFKDPRTLTVVSWLNTHLSFCVAILIPVLVLTICSFLAHRWRYRLAQTSQQVYDQSLFTVARGVQRALDELNAKPAAPFHSLIAVGFATQ